MAPDPGAVAARLERHGIPSSVDPDGRWLVPLGTASLLIERGEPRRPFEVSAVGSAPAAPAGAHAPAVVGGPTGHDPVPTEGATAPRLVAVGLATVDHQRFAGDHGLGPLTAGPTDDLLGAWTWTVGGPLPIVILEPATEGRLAASLARVGEGPLVVYLAGVAATLPSAGAAGAQPSAQSLADPAGGAVAGRRGSSAFGSATLYGVAGAQPGPSVVVVDGAGTRPARR